MISVDSINRWLIVVIGVDHLNICTKKIAVWKLGQFTLGLNMRSKYTNTRLAGNNNKTHFIYVEGGPARAGA